MICPFILLAMISFASAQPSMSDIAKTCSSKTAIIDGHLHMTSIVGARQKQECSINLQETNRHVFLEFERYGGRKPDAKAWTNITFVGTPNVTVTINNNAITIGDKTVHMNAYSKLEQSMTLLSAFQGNNIQLEFAPVGSSKSGFLDVLNHISKGQILIKTETETGMEQVLRNVFFNRSDKSRTIPIKTIHELERRISELDKDLTPKLDNIFKILDKHQTLLEKKQEIGYTPVAVIIMVLFFFIGTYARTKRKKIMLD